jgi:SAM-dependent methyltransferase
MTGLTESDVKQWSPVREVVEHVSSIIPKGARVLEVGPGRAPFSRATHYVDYVQRGELNITICDVANEPLPFHDKFFDFVYCRHVCEDMFNPFPLIAEMERVGKAGYIETPSPIAELCRGVDGCSPIYRGYHHHRFMAWVEGDQLMFVSKYPLVEYAALDDEQLAAFLRCGAAYWNTHYIWKDKINVKHLQNDLDFDMMADYPKMLGSACNAAFRANNAFCLDRLSIDLASGLRRVA